MITAEETQEGEDVCSEAASECAETLRWRVSAQRERYMERSTRILRNIPFKTVLGTIGIILGLWNGSSEVRAGVKLAPFQPPPPSQGPGENYPESRFGNAPLQPEIGGRSRVQPEEIDQTLSDPESTSRKPAGLEFTTQKGHIQMNPIVPGSELPTSPSNLNPKPSAVSRTGVQEIALIAGDLGFFPKTVFVTRDIPVRMFVTGASKKPLCIMMDSFQVRKQVRSQKIEEVSFIPTTPGQYRFYCPVNGMEGTLFVKELSTVANITTEGTREGSRGLSSSEKKSGE